MNYKKIKKSVISTFSKLIPETPAKNYIRKKIWPPIYYDKYKIIPEQHHTLNKVYNIQSLKGYYASEVSFKNSALKKLKTSPGNVKTFHYNGKDYYHPSMMAGEGLKLISAFKKTNTEEYIHLAKIQAEKLMQEADIFIGLPYFPYRHDWKVGEYPAKYADGLMKAPWYSGLSQGRALALFSLLYDLTGEDKHLENANKTFKTLTILREEKKTAPWLAYIDDRGYFWIEEYPMENQPSNVLNGFIAAIFGLYDYYQATKNGDFLLNQSLQTIEHYLPKFRNPGNISFYDLKYKNKFDAYHETHINQLIKLHKITNEPYFKTMADLFRRDIQREKPLNKFFRDKLKKKQ